MQSSMHEQQSGLPRIDADVANVGHQSFYTITPAPSCASTAMMQPSFGIPYSGIPAWIGKDSANLTVQDMVFGFNGEAPDVLRGGL